MTMYLYSCVARELKLAMVQHIYKSGPMDALCKTAYSHARLNMQALVFHVIFCTVRYNCGT